MALQLCQAPLFLMRLYISPPPSDAANCSFQSLLYWHWITCQCALEALTGAPFGLFHPVKNPVPSMVSKSETVPPRSALRPKESYAAMAYASSPSSIALPAASVARLDTALVLIM